MPIIYVKTNILMPTPAGFICNRCNDFFDTQPFATLNTSIDNDLSTYCEQCYENIVEGDKIEPSSVKSMKYIEKE